MQRRHFIQNTLLLSVIPSILASCTKDDAKPKKRILIIGAGLAGLSTAMTLMESGHEVEILEAASVWGGRIKSLTNFADFPVELGAEELHGEKSAWAKLVKKQSGVQLVNDDEIDFYEINEQLQSEDFLTDNSTYQPSVNFIENATTLGGNRTAEEAAITSNVAQFDWVEAQIGNEYGTSNDRLNLAGIASEDAAWSAGNQNNALANQSYYQTMESIFSAQIPLVRLNTIVKTIDYSGIEPSLTDSTGKTWTADHIVVTVSLKILQRGDIQFTPDLPASKKNALQNIGMDSAGIKIIVAFTERFWPENLGSIYLKSAIKEIWYTSRGRGTKPVLTGFINGKNAEYLQTLGNDAAILDYFKQELDVVFDGKATQFFEKGQVQDWSKEAFVGGAYSYPKTADVLTQRKNLAASLDKKVYFAGEATHFEGHSGSMHGAFESGVRVAEEILNE
jgi:monoamine oxidase